MVLSGEAIKKGIEKGIIGIEPFSESQVEHAHVNLHLGSVDGVDGNEYILESRAL